MTTVDSVEDPDGFDAAAMARVAEAATLLRDLAIPRPEAVDRVVERVRVEAFLSGLAGTVFGSMSRVAQAAPELLGLTDPVTSTAEDEDQR